MVKHKIARSKCVPCSHRAACPAPPLQIGKMLNAHEPKVVNGPEVLSKYVGQAEENIRKLFEDAEREQVRPHACSV